MDFNDKNNKEIILKIFNQNDYDFFIKENILDLNKTNIIEEED